MEKKNNKGIAVTLVIAIFIILGLGGYIVYDKVLSTEKESKQEENKKEEVNEEKKYEEIATDNELIKKLMCRVNLTSLTSGDFAGYFYSKDRIINTDIDNDIKMFLAFHNIGKRIGDTISQTQMKDSIKNIFGLDDNYKDVKEGVGGCPWGKFDENTKSYKVMECTGLGGSLIPYYETTIVKALKYEDKIEIFEKVIYIRYTDNDEKVSKNIYAADKKTIIDENIDGDNYNINNYLNELDSYKYTFNLEDGKYYFYSVEKVED